MLRPSREQGLRTVACSVGMAVVLVVVGCARDPEEGSAVESAPPPVGTVGEGTEAPADIIVPDVDVADDKAADGYIRGIVSASPSVVRDALQYAASDSVAYGYLQHRVNLFEAALDGGVQYGDQPVEPIDGGCELCDPVDVTDCSEFTELETVDGRVADLLVDRERRKAPTGVFLLQCVLDPYVPHVPHSRGT